MNAVLRPLTPTE